MRTKIMLAAALAALAGWTGAGAQALCAPPQQGDWIVAQSCTFQGQATAPANVIVQPGVTLTLAAGADLNIDFANRHLRVRTGARVLVKQGAKIR